MDKYYEILNIKKGTNLVTLKKAYRKAVHMYHPDSNGGIGDTEKFKQAVIAYNYLKKHHKVLGLEPVPKKQSVFALFFNRIFSAPKKKSPAGTYTKNYWPPRRKAQAWEHKDKTVDPLVYRLNYQELKDRFEESTNDFVRKEAAKAMALLFGGGALPVLKKGLKNSSPALTEVLVFCLGIIGDRESIMIIEKYLRHPDVKIACCAVNALKMINQGHAITLLEKMEQDGRAISLWFSRFIGTLRFRKLIRKGIIEPSEIYIAAALRRHTRQPLPIILRELGLVAE
ncbi:MAG: DnaJ domain-containing protein [Nitrospinota bacterium]